MPVCSCQWHLRSAFSGILGCPETRNKSYKDVLLGSLANAAAALKLERKVAGLNPGPDPINKILA